MYAWSLILPQCMHSKNRGSNREKSALLRHGEHLSQTPAYLRSQSKEKETRKRDAVRRLDELGGHDSKPYQLPPISITTVQPFTHIWLCSRLRVRHNAVMMKDHLTKGNNCANRKLVCWQLHYPSIAHLYSVSSRLHSVILARGYMASPTGVATIRIHVLRRHLSSGLSRISKTTRHTRVLRLSAPELISPPSAVRVHTS